MANESYPDFVAARPVVTAIDEDTDALLLVQSGITYQTPPSYLLMRRGLVALARTSAEVAYNNSTDTIVNFDDLQFDLAGSAIMGGVGAVTVGANWQYENPIAGWYDVRITRAFILPQAAAYAANAFVEFDLYVNGVQVDTVAYYESGGTAGTDQWLMLIGSGTLLLNVGDTVHVQFYNGSGATRKIDQGAAIEIYRVA